MPPHNARLPEWEVLGGETLQGNDGSQAATVPSEATIINMVAESGVAYYQFGNGIASALSAGFVPENERATEGPLRDLGANGMVIFAATGVNLHILYYRENRGH